MIARLWGGSAAREKADAYVAHLQQIVFPQLAQLDGYRGGYILRRDLDDGIEFKVLTLWESLNAIRKFSGENVETAVVAPAARALLRAYDSTVTHYETV